MSLNKISLKLKLTILYSTLLFVFGVIILTSINFAYSRQINRIAPPRLTRQQLNIPSGITKDEAQDIIEKQVEILKDRKSKDADELKQNSFLLLIPITIISFIIGYLLSANALSPLERLAKDISEVNPETLSKRLEESPTPEIQIILQNFNNLLSRLEDSFKSQKQFVQDASHELRSPIAAIHATIESTLLTSDSKKEYKLSLEKSLDQVKKLSELTSHLLDLSNIQSHDEEFDLTKIVNEVTSSSSFNFAKIDLSNISYKMNGDSTSIRRVITNLIDNSKKYSDKDAPIINFKYWVSQDLGVSKITISNNGPLVPKKDREKIFDRFFQVEKARDNEVKGYGLGLALVKKIVDEHKGAIEYKTDNGLNVFEITF